MPFVKGSRHTPEARAKIGDALRGRSRPDISAAKKGKPTHSKGKPVSPEQRAKISATMTGRKLTPEHRAAISAASKGHPVSPEQRAKIAAAHLGVGVGNRYAKDAPVLGECAYCFAPAQTRDHVIPRGRPGWDDPENVVLACWSCNTWKHNRTPEEWFAQDVA